MCLPYVHTVSHCKKLPFFVFICQCKDALNCLSLEMSRSLNIHFIVKMVTILFKHVCSAVDEISSVVKSTLQYYMSVSCFPLKESE